MLEKSVTNVVEKIIERLWNVIEFGFENCVETLEDCFNFIDFIDLVGCQDGMVIQI